MNEIPMKHYFMGKDVDTLSREELIEAIKVVFKELEATRSIAQINNRMHMAFHEAALRRKYV